jgi:hypothetical protein
MEADHGRLTSRLRPMRGLKRLRSGQVIGAGHPRHLIGRHRCQPRPAYHQRNNAAGPAAGGTANRTAHDWLGITSSRLLDGMGVRAGASPHVNVGCRAGQAVLACRGRHRFGPHGPGQHGTRQGGGHRLRQFPPGQQLGIDRRDLRQHHLDLRAPRHTRTHRRDQARRYAIGPPLGCSTSSPSNASRISSVALGWAVLPNAVLWMPTSAPGRSRTSSSPTGRSARPRAAPTLP